jgi:two-component system OmpR family sensor kinase/two-component system sensor histidine kinase QseC
VRACTVPLAEGTLTLCSSAEEASTRKPLLAWSVLTGIVIGALVGGFFSYRAAVWALSPLEVLSARVRGVRPEDPRPEILAPELAQSELEALRLAITELVEELRDALASARAFASQAAHELRTPLTTIGGELELLAESVPERNFPSLNAARRRVADLVTLVQRLLILAQPDPLGDGAEAVDLSDVLSCVRLGLPSPLGARVEGHAEDDVLVRGDATLLTALLTNGVDNALKFSDGPVQVRIWRAGGKATIEVSDQGPGIEPDDQERVFSPFYRAASARRSEALGHGVGLALIAHVARVHGGCVQIESEPGRGTRLLVELPIWTPRAGG